MNVRVINKNIQSSACQAENSVFELFKATGLRDIEREGLDTTGSECLHGIQSARRGKNFMAFQEMRPYSSSEQTLIIPRK